MNKIYKWLNAFAWAAKSERDGRKTNLIVGILLAFSVFICAWMSMGNIEKKLVIMIDAVELDGVDSVALGRGSTVSLNQVPEDFLGVKFTGSDATWQVNDKYKDTLQYFKVNNDNPQKIPIADSPATKISVQLPCTTSLGNDTTVSVEIDGSTVWRYWRQIGKQQNIQLRHLAAKHMLESAANDTVLRSLLYRQMERRDVRSFFHATYGRLGGLSGIQLVVLDTHTQVEGASQSGYKKTDIIHTGSGQCKVQFFTVSSSCYKVSDSGEYFNVDGVNYVMKTPPVLSEWGAGHVMLKHNERGMRIVYPKAIGYVGSLDTLRAKAGKQSGIVTFRQMGSNFPTSSDLYLPQFCGAIGQDICNVEMAHGGDSIVIRDCCNHAFLVKNPTTGPLPFSLIPALKKITLDSGNQHIECRVGIINSGFILSYLWLPILVGLVLIFLVLARFSPFRIKSIGNDVYSSDQIVHFPVYLAMLICVAMVYCVCKSLIALKLSYTFPYFEKLTAITPVTTSLMLLVAFTLIMLFNFGLLNYRNSALMMQRGQKTGLKMSVWIVWGIVAAIFVGVLGVFFFMLDRQVAGAMIESYFKSEISFFPNWMSSNAHGVNDNHRTVPYALISVEAVLLVLVALVNLMPRLVSKMWTSVDGLSAWTKNVVGTIVAFFLRFIPLPRLGQGIAKAYHDFDSKNANKKWWKWTSFVLRWLHHSAMVRAIPAAWSVLWPNHVLLLLLLAIVCPMMGNFGTAFITLSVIAGLSRALTKNQIADPANSHKTETPALVVLATMIYCVVIYALAAMVADHGYLTNFLGFVMAMLSFFFIMQRPELSTNANVSQLKHERRWTIIVSAFAVVLVVLLPFFASLATDSANANYSRMNRRLMLYSNFDHLQSLGYRYSESDAEFMVIMSHYLQQHGGDDPLSNDQHPLHASVSTGQSPVVLNDLSVPAAFFGAYGVRRTTAVYFALLLSLLLLTIQFSMTYYPSNGEPPRLTRAMQWRLLAVFMWVGTSFYIYFSYIDWLPFTGRLNPGFGVDAVGEALESAVLLAFMGTVTVFRPSKTESPSNSVGRDCPTEDEGSKGEEGPSVFGDESEKGQSRPQSRKLPKGGKPNGRQKQAEQAGAATTTETIVSAGPAVFGESDEPNEPAIAEPTIADEPVVAEPTIANEPVTAEPTIANEPVVAEPTIANEPVVAEPTIANEPVIAEPTIANEPVIAEPTIANEPVTAEPTIANEPVVAEPTIANEPVVAEPAIANEPEVAEPKEKPAFSGEDEQAITPRKPSVLGVDKPVFGDDDEEDVIVATPVDDYDRPNGGDNPVF